MQDVFNRFRRVLIFGSILWTFFVSVAASFLLRFDFVLPPAQRLNLLWGLAICLPLKLAVFHLARIHRGWWSTVGVRDLKRMFLANVLASRSSLALLPAALHSTYSPPVYF